MLATSATPYSSLPPMPTINAMPDGIPRGPWGALYRSAPGAQIPAVRYPGMQGAPVQILGALGANGEASWGRVALGVALSAGYAAGLAYMIRSRKPVRNAALFAGGLALGGGLLMKFGVA